MEREGGEGWRGAEGAYLGCELGFDEAAHAGEPLPNGHGHRYKRALQRGRQRARALQHRVWVAAERAGHCFHAGAPEPAAHGHGAPEELPKEHQPGDVLRRQSKPVRQRLRQLPGQRRQQVQQGERCRRAAASAASRSACCRAASAACSWATTWSARWRSALAAASPARSA